MNIALVVLSKLATLGILLIFGAIGYWGHHTHWQFFLKAEEHHADLETPKTSSDSIAFEESASLSNLGIQLQLAKSQDVREVVPAIGTVTFNGQRYSQLSTRADGHVLHVFAHLGQSVRKGDVLALIDSQVVGEAKSDWLQKAVSARYHQRTLHQLTNSADSLIPQARIRAVEAEVREAELASFMAQQRLMNLGFHIDFELDLDASPNQLADQIRFLGISKELISQLPVRPTTANLIAIHAPFDGVVVEQDAVAGEMVSSDEFQFIVADTSTMWVKLSVVREDATKISVGQTVEFMPDGCETPIITKISRIDSEIDAETQTIQACCEIDNDFAIDYSPQSLGGPTNARSNHRMLKANQFGTAKICVANRPNAVLVPATAIQRLPDQTSVAFVSKGDNTSFERRQVQIGINHEGYIEVLEGVSHGEMVVAEGSFILKSELMRSSLVGG